jgi:hypothetical protein
MQLHFGLGANTMVDSARIDWPSHQVTHYTSLMADQFVTVTEGGCNITGVVIPGPYDLCTGQTKNLMAPTGFVTYAWSNGDNTPSTVISSPGFYNVMVMDINGCSAISTTIEVQLNPDETPTITASNELIFCEGGSITLTASPAISYTWSNGQTTQSISVNASGIYTVTIQGLCASFTSDPQVVDVLAAPVPVAYDDSAVSPNTVTLTATGNDLSWYDAQTGGNLVGTGSTFITPVLTTSTTYWVENASGYGGSTGYTGQTYHTGANFYTNNTTNRELYFDVLDDCILHSVKVYTDMPGVREIDVYNSFGTLVHSVSVNIPMDSSRITLDFNLAPGTGYYITTNDSVNQVSLGFISPELRRSTVDVTFPYSISDVISITGSSTQYYYYFYDWEVEVPPMMCTSIRIPVQAILLTPDAVTNFTVENHFVVYPNPADQLVNISFNNTATPKSSVEFIDAVGHVVSAITMEAVSGNFKQSFDVSSFAKGVYTIHVTSGDKTSYQQLIIQ